MAFRTRSNGTVQLSQVQNYYPFGSDMGDSTMNYSLDPQNFYKYSDKEKQTELGLDTYDFGARHYDAILGRWMGIDPLSWLADGQSPYNYTENNPMNMVDSDGMQAGRGLPVGHLAEVTIRPDKIPRLPHLAGPLAAGASSLIGSWSAFSAKDPTRYNLNVSGVQGNPRNETISAYNPANRPEPNSLEDWAQKQRLTGLDPVSFGGGDLGYGIVPGIYQGFQEAPAVILPELFIAKLRYVIWGAEAVEFAIKGETAATRLGRAVHSVYKEGLADNLNTFKEFNGIKGIRPDFVDFNSKTIYELKPNNPKAIREGFNQLNKYKSLFEKQYGGSWKIVLDKY